MLKEVPTREATPEVEVLLCTFNGEPHLIDQLRSLLDQTRPVDRIVIRDDASTDSTVQLVRAFVDQCSKRDAARIVLNVNPVNVGYARNFEAALGSATGDVLFLCDQDDVWEPQKVERLLQALEETGADMAFSDGTIVDTENRPLTASSVLDWYGLRERDRPAFQSRGFECLLKRNYVNGAAMAIRRASAQESLPLPCDMPHDYWLAVWCAFRGGAVAVPDRLYRYRQHDRNAIGVGTGSAIWTITGLWRYPDAPRERELRIWEAMTERLAMQQRPQVASARRKVDWLRRVVPEHKRSWRRLLRIAASAIRGEYRRYSADHAMLRDLISVLRWRDR